MHVALMTHHLTNMCIHDKCVVCGCGMWVLYVCIVCLCCMHVLFDGQRVRKISELFEGAYKSSHSVVILDGLELLLAWSRIGPSFSNAVLQALFVLIKQPPPPPRRMLVLATSTNGQAMEELELMHVFDAVLHLEPLQTEEAMHVLMQSGVVSSDVLPYVQDMLQGQNIPIKKLLTVADLARCAYLPFRSLLLRRQNKSQLLGAVQLERRVVVISQCSYCSWCLFPRIP